jgi:hypothetical protein
MCTVLMPSGGYPIAVKYIIPYHEGVRSVYVFLGAHVFPERSQRNESSCNKFEYISRKFYYLRRNDKGIYDLEYGMRTGCGGGC